jgi:aminoglycoside phosphotransferase (APT) family kinase protein
VPDDRFTSDLADRLRTALLPEHVNPTLARRERYRWSEHFVFTTNGHDAHERSVLVKHFSQQQPDRRQSIAGERSMRARREYDALGIIAGMIADCSDDDLTEVRPVACLSDVNAVAMEYKPGTNLKILAARAASAFGSARDRQVACHCAAAAGHWLGNLHTRIPTPPAQSSYSASDAVGRVRTLVDEVSGSVGARVSEFLRAETVRFEQTIGEDRHSLTVRLHGDFYPENIIRTGERAYVVDTTLEDVGPPADDVAKFIVGLQTMKPRVVIPILISRASIDAMTNAFMAAYAEKNHLSNWWLGISLLRARIVRWTELAAVADHNWPRPVAALAKSWFRDRCLTEAWRHS